MKILAAEQIQNIEVATEYKLSLDSKLRSRASVQAVKLKTRIRQRKHYDAEMEENVTYRSNHFLKTNGEIYCYFPKHFVRDPTCFLHCENENCDAKLFVDMKRKKGRRYGKHRHEGIDISQFENEFPEIKDEKWSHMQYDIKNNKKFMVWKT